MPNMSSLNYKLFVVHSRCKFTLALLIVLVTLSSKLKTNADDWAESFSNEMDSDTDDMNFDEHIDMSILNDFLSLDKKARSLEFVLEQYKRSRQAEETMDKLLKNVILVEKDRRLMKQVQERSYEIRMLSNRAGSLKMNGKLGQIGKSEMTRGILELVKSKQSLLEDSEALISNGTSQFEVEAFEKEKQKMHDEISQLSDNKDEYAQHMLLFPVIVGIKDFDLPNHKGDFIDFDITVLENLLKLYKRVERLKQTMETLEDDEGEKALVEQEIKSLEEQKIPELKNANKEMMNRYFPSYTGIATRNLRKIQEVDKLYKTLSKLMSKLEEELNSFLEDVRKLNDDMEEAAKVWTGMKDEL